MKIIKPLLSIFLILTAYPSFSQKDSTQYNKWSATVFVGIALPFDRDTYNNSASAGFEISYNYTPYTAVFFNGNYYFVRRADNYQNYLKEQLVETSIGTKFYLNPGHDRVFLQIGLGDYQLIKQYDYSEYSGGYYTENIDRFGLSTGLGSDIHIYKKIDASINVNLHFVGFLINEEGLIFWGINSGIKYSF